MKKLEIIAEINKDGYGVYTENERFAGMGDTLDNAIQDLKNGIAFYVETAKRKGLKFSSYLDNDYVLDVHFNVQNILEYYSGIISNAGLERLTGIDSQQIWRYAHGKAKPRKPQIKKIEKAFQKLGAELSAVAL